MPSGRHRSRARSRADRERHRRERAWEAKVRHRHRHRRRHRGRRRAVTALVSVFALAGIAFAALLYLDLRSVRRHLTDARSLLLAAVANPNALRTDEGRAATRASMDEALTAVGRAREHAGQSFSIEATRWLPGLRNQRTGLLAVIDDSAAATGTGRDLLAKLDSVASDTSLLDGAIPLGGLRRLQGDLHAASVSVAELVRSPKGLWGPLRDARRDFDNAAGTTAQRLADGAGALDAALPFMGEREDRRYFVAIQNNAEMRDQGMVLSYAVVRFVSGRLVFERNGSVADLALRAPAAVDIPEGTAEVFGSINPTTLWHSVNATADFSWSGAAMQQMFFQATGQRVDGVIAIDVVGLQRLIAAIGEVNVPGIPEPVGPNNAARILLHDLYEGLPPSSDQAPRRELLSDVTRAVINRMTTGRRDAVLLGRELGVAAEGGHFRLWSASAQEEELFVRTGLGGGPGSISPERTFHVAVQNRTATKLDYFVTFDLRADVRLTRSGDAVVRTTVIIENNAPKDGAPSYALGPDQYMTGPGDYRAWVLQWAPAGSQSGATTVVESGLPLQQHVLAVAPGQRQEITLPDTVVPKAVKDGRLQLRFVPQPRLEAPNLEVNLVAPGWKVSSPKNWSGGWDRVTSVSWNVRS